MSYGNHAYHYIQILKTKCDVTVFYIINTELYEPR
jgi:hypothetical protein